MIFLPTAIAMFFWILVLLGLITGLVFFILTLVAAMNCLEGCRRRNREMAPGQVWLSLIPAFGAVWIYFVIVRVEQALRLEYRDRGLRRPKDFGQPIGLAAIICWQAGAVLLCLAIGVLGMLAGAGIFIAYWQRLAKHAKELQRSHRGSDYEEEDYDDRPRRSRRNRDDEYEEEEDRPRRRRSRRDEEDEEDDRPRRRSRRDEDDEDGDWKR